jgi:hypothetical protein
VRGIVGYSNIEHCSNIGKTKMNNVQEEFRQDAFGFPGMTGLAVETAAGLKKTVTVVT